MDIFEIERSLAALLAIALLAIKIFAFVNALLYSKESYVAAGKLTKPAWCIILALAVVVQALLSGVLFLNLALTIAALVYLADVRPALTGLKRR